MALLDASLARTNVSLFLPAKLEKWVVELPEAPVVAVVAAVVVFINNASLQDSLVAR